MLQELTTKLAWRLLSAGCLCLCIGNAIAQQRDPNEPWWFEIEAIIFERNTPLTEINEVFDLAVTPIDTMALPNFILDTLRPDISTIRDSAPVCLEEPAVPDFPKQTVPALRFNQHILQANDSQITPITSQDNSGPVFLESALSSAKLNDPQHIVEQRPAQAMSQRLSNFAHDLQEVQTELFDPAPVVLKSPIYDMFQLLDAPKKSDIGIPNSVYCQWSTETAMFATDEGQTLKEAGFLHSVDVVLDGVELPYAERAYALPAEQLKLTSLKTRIQRTRGLNVLLHSAWRQDVKIGRNNAPWYRIQAGINHSRDYLYTGLPRENVDAGTHITGNQPDIVAKIQAILNSPETTVSALNQSTTLQSLLNSPLNQQFPEVWTLDGRLRIFIEYIGGTPYLHIDSDMNYRVPVYVDWSSIDKPGTMINVEPPSPDSNAIPPSPNMLQAFHFDQLRRVISNEIHYFDHPLFGMVFQIRRYKRPPPPESDTPDLLTE